LIPSIHDKEHAMEKPVVFLSHSSKDAKALSFLKKRLSEMTGDTLRLFLSSDGQSIPFGRNWVSQIEEALGASTLMFSFLSPQSVSSLWVHFEAGFAYAKGAKVVPVGIGGVTLDSLPPPLSLLQGFNISNYSGLNNIVAVINTHFDVKHTESFTEEHYNDIFGQPGASPFATFQSHSKQIDYIEIVLDYDQNGLDKLADKLSAKHEITRPNTIQVVTYGLELRQTPGPKGARIQCRIAPELFDLHNAFLVEALDLSDSHTSLRVAVHFKAGISASFESWRLTSKFYGSDFKILGDGFEYKTIAFSLEYKISASSKRIWVMRADAAVLRQPSILGQIVDDLFIREVLQIRI
jgi:hypothetical protein